MLSNNSPLEHLAAFAIVLATGYLLGFGLPWHKRKARE